MHFWGWQIRFVAAIPWFQCVGARLLKRRTSSGSGRETKLSYRIRNVAESPDQGTVFEGARIAPVLAIWQRQRIYS